MIRPYRESDLPVLKALHEAQGHPYPFPDLTQFLGVMVATDERDVPVQAIAIRKTVEVYMLGDPTWRTPAWRFQTLRTLHLAVHEWLLTLGYTDAHAWLPPSVEKSFGRRLKKVFGWTPSIWKCYSKEL